MFTLGFRGIEKSERIKRIKEFLLLD